MADNGFVPRQPLPASFYNPEEPNPLIRALMKEPSIPNPANPPTWARQAIIEALRPVLDSGQWLGGVMAGNVKPTMGDAITNLGGAALAGVMPPGARAAPMAERVAAQMAEHGLVDLGREAPAGIRAFHGSPHDFNAFDLSKIGTGEGAQAYGHGLYFAENEGTAKAYRDALSARLSGENPVQAGHMYEVNINAHPEHFLDWDKPLSEQSEHVQDAVKTRLGLDLTKADMEKSGAFLMDHLGRNNPDTSQALREAGIPGIKYLDQGSRGRTGSPVKTDEGWFVGEGGRRLPSSAGPFESEAAARAWTEQGTRNYVAFDDKIIDLIKKYGIAGLGAIPAGEAALNPLSPVVKKLGED